jgi:hypothetical protein
MVADPPEPRNQLIDFPAPKKRGLVYFSNFLLSASNQGRSHTMLGTKIALY